MRLQEKGQQWKQTGVERICFPERNFNRISNFATKCPTVFFIYIGNFVFNICISSFININCIKYFHFIILMHAYDKIETYLLPALLTSLPLHLVLMHNIASLTFYFIFLFFHPEFHRWKQICHTKLCESHWLGLKCWSLVPISRVSRGTREEPCLQKYGGKQGVTPEDFLLFS